MRLKESPEFFENLADYVDEESLSRYEGTKDFWILILDNELNIGEVCFAFYSANSNQILKWNTAKQIKIKRHFAEIPKSDNGWMVVSFEDTYFLKPYNRK